MLRHIVPLIVMLGAATPAYGGGPPPLAEQRALKAVAPLASRNGVPLPVVAADEIGRAAGPAWRKMGAGGRHRPADGRLPVEAIC